jgi:voltage-gated potassium channel
VLANGVDPPSVSPGRRAVLVSTARAVGTTALVLVLYFTLPFDRDLEPSVVLVLVAGVAVLVAVIALQVAAIVRAAHPGLRAIEALATSVSLFLVVFSLSYVLMSTYDAQSFTQPLTRLDALYFAITVFATVGFGDIVARTQPARILVTVQMAGDLIVLGLGLKIIVGAVKVGQSRRSAGVPAGTVRRRSSR